MKQKIILGMVCLFMLVFLGGCYCHVKAPYDTDLDKTILGEKEGRSHCKSIMWLVSWGDAGTKAAAENGNITVVHHMDREIFYIAWGLYFKHTTIVYGE